MKKHILVFFAILTLIPAKAFAVGSGAFENASFSPQSIAESNAVVAQATEPAAISYNPAGITQLKGLNVQQNFTFINIFTRHSQNGDEHYSAQKFIGIPTGYMTVNPGILNNRVALGVGADAPFGLANQYESYHPHVKHTGYVNYLKMYAVKPVVSFKLNEKLSIGGGPVWYRIFDFGTVLAYPNSALAASLPGLGFETAPDGQLRANLSGNTWGWHMGVLAKPWKKHQFGFYFRSPVTVLVKGLIKVENSRATGTSQNFETGGYGKVELPLNFTWAYAYKPNERTNIETDFGFTRWSAHKRLYINADPVSAGDDGLLAAVGKTDKNYDNGFSLHLGGNRKLKRTKDKLTLRGGWLFYWTPIPDQSFIPAVPDANSMAFSTGLSYDINKYFRLDCAYFARIWLRRQVNNSNATESVPNGPGSVDGKYMSYGHEIFLGVTYKWENFLPGKKNDQGSLTDGLAKS